MCYSQKENSLVVMYFYDCTPGNRHGENPEVALVLIVFWNICVLLLLNAFKSEGTARLAHIKFAWVSDGLKMCFSVSIEYFCVSYVSV